MTFTIEKLEYFKKAMDPTPPFLEALIAEKRENQRIRKELEKAREIYRDDTYPGSKGVVVRITRILEGNA